MNRKTWLYIGVGVLVIAFIAVGITLFEKNKNESANQSDDIGSEKKDMTSEVFEEMEIEDKIAILERYSDFEKGTLVSKGEVSAKIDEWLDELVVEAKEDGASETEYPEEVPNVMDKVEEEFGEETAYAYNNGLLLSNEMSEYEAEQMGIELQNYKYDLVSHSFIQVSNEVGKGLEVNDANIAKYNESDGKGLEEDFKNNDKYMKDTEGFKEVEGNYKVGNPRLFYRVKRDVQDVLDEINGGMEEGDEGAEGIVESINNQPPTGLYVDIFIYVEKDMGKKGLDKLEEEFRVNGGESGVDIISREWLQKDDEDIDEEYDFRAVEGSYLRVHGKVDFKDVFGVAETEENIQKFDNGELGIAKVEVNGAEYEIEPMTIEQYEEGIRVIDSER